MCMQTKSIFFLYSFHAATESEMRNIIGLILILPAITPSPMYNITNVTNTFIFEKCETIQIQSSTWTFISHVNLTNYIEELAYAAYLINTIEIQCKSMISYNSENEICHGIVLQLKTELDEIYDTDQYIISSEKANNRNRRGLVNAGGNLIKILFGNPNADDAEKFTAQILELQEATQHMERHVNVHTTILNSVLIKLNETSAGINKHTQMLDELKNEIALSARTGSIYSRVHYQFEELFNYISLILSKIQRDQTKLFDIIFSAKKGFLHASLFDPKVTFEEMMSAQITLRSQHFPFPLRKVNMYKILELSSFNAAIYNNVILFEIETPLVREETFNIFNAIPIPQQVKNNQYSIIQPEHRTFIINKQHTLFAPFPDHEMQIQRNCKVIESEKYICKLHSPMYVPQAKKNCEIYVFLTSILDSNLCKESPFTLNDQYWIYLREPGTFIFVTPHPQSITIFCGETPETVEIMGTGLIQTTCDITTNNIIISGASKYHSKVTLSHIRSIIQLPERKNVPNNNNPIIRRSSDVHAIEPIYHNILDKTNITSFTEPQQTTHTTTIIIIIFIVAVAILYVFAIWLYMGGIKRTNNQQENSNDQPT
jgi:hypothetical protein